MEIVGKVKLSKFCDKHTDGKSQIQSWIAEAEGNSWNSPNEIKERYQTASFLGENKVVFNIKGNRYRLVVKVDYINQVILIKAIDTHAEYTKWNLE